MSDLPIVEELANDDPRVTQLTTVPEDMTVGDFCRDSIEKIIQDRVPSHSYCVLHEGAIYYLDIICSAIKPPYTRQLPDDKDLPGGTALWMGQRKN